MLYFSPKSGGLFFLSVGRPYQRHLVAKTLNTTVILGKKIHWASG